MIENFHAVIPAGGSGTRLWPLSRRDRPKFLHDVLGIGSTLLQATWTRAARLADPSHTWVVTGEAHVEAVSAQLPALREDRIVAEPSPKDSAAAIGLAAMLISDADPDAVIGSFSADHSITNEGEFVAVVEQAAAAAASTGDIVTIGITPTYPATAYGYIKTGALLGIPGAPTARRAAEFVEKPDAVTARTYAYSGGYRWNAGMFIMRATALLELIRQEAPALHGGLRRIADAAGSDRWSEVMAREWPLLEKKAIDYVVAEPAAAAGRVIVVPGDFGWDDVGDFDSVAKLRQPVPGERTAVSVVGEADVIDVSSRGVVVSETGRAVALVGVHDVVVVDTDDVVLVTSRTHAQQVKQAVAEAEARGRDDLL
ncbi:MULTISPECIES: mannose-1-phosphate guanylyltransferase [Brevibacterium]|uniref:Mannose-1-phosphate guanylyltransferase n=1 Tax=Brevibacterium salitolerans TaxID=1403566 RepID=A0ABP5ILJ5_9MICO|nr:mannose-1-phosphate guanylyltransferase [Brevibacterium sp.]